MFWTAGSNIKKCGVSFTKIQGLFRKIAAEGVSIVNSRRISIGRSRLDRGKGRAALRPKQEPDGESRGGAMIGKRQTSLSGIIQQTESTGRKNETWRTHLG
jgi:hypothetical protein